jgi:hypothetical protein
MTFSFNDFGIRSAAFTVMLLAFVFIMAGCRSSLPDPRAFNTPPNDAYALSGGKITHFTSMPFLLSNPADKAMLEACQQLPIHTNTARSALLVVSAGQFGRVPLHAMVVGDRVLILPGDFARLGIMCSGDSHSFTLYPTSPQSMTFIHDSKIAFVGNKKMQLQWPMIATQSADLVMTLSDMKSVFHERDVQRHQPPFIRDAQIIYDIRDYHR